MATEVILPKLGQTMEEGTIVEWLKQEGDEVRRGEILFTVESDKATLEAESPGRGILRKILVPGGETVPVLTVVGVITRTADEDISSFDRSGAAVVGDAPGPSTGVGDLSQAARRASSRKERVRARERFMVPQGCLGRQVRRQG